jgi:hypothetical protein
MILERSELLESDAEFRIAVGKIDQAQEYSSQTSGSVGRPLLREPFSFAEALESQKHNPAASLIYMSLLVSILERGYSKAYRHGIRYLKKLDTLAVSITDWKSFHYYKVFKDRIYHACGCKRR